MVFCSDKALTYLNRQGYNVVRLPRKGTSPLDVLGRDTGALEKLDDLSQIWRYQHPLPTISPPQAATQVNGQKTGDLSASMGLKILGVILGALGAKIPELSAVYTAADSLEFEFHNVMSRSVTPLAIGRFLAQGDIQSDNPVVNYYFSDNETETYVIVETLESDEIAVTAKDSSGANLQVSVPSIQNAVGVDIAVAGKSAGNSSIAYKGSESVTFGFKLFSIAFDGRWRIHGAQAHEILSFTVGETSNPIILRRGTLALK
jgi:hypothetical protein